MRVRENRSPKEPYFQPLKVEAGKTVEIYYRVRNRGPLPAEETVHFSVEPDGGASIKGETKHFCDLDVGGTMETTRRITVREDVMLEARGMNGTVPDTALYITVTGK